MAVFEAASTGGAEHPDAAEVLQLRFVTESEAAALPKEHGYQKCSRRYFVVKTLVRIDRNDGDRLASLMSGAKKP